VVELERLPVQPRSPRIAGVLPDRDVGEACVVALRLAVLGVVLLAIVRPTRPARSSDWFSSSAPPGSLSSAKKRSRSSAMRSIASARPRALRDMPQWSQTIPPSSRWKESTLRPPRPASSRSSRACASARVRSQSGWEASSGARPPRAR
jgi:hypothetical protein